MAALSAARERRQLYLLLDECCGKALAAVAERAGHTAQRTIEVASLGRGATDAAIFDFAVQVGAVVVTVNRGNFIALAGRARRHAGVILIPSLPAARLRPLFETVLTAAEPLLAGDPNTIVEIDPSGRISRPRPR